MTKETSQLGIPDEFITSKIFLIRDKKVMLDHDLAKLYNVETKVVKQAVRRNIGRFPDDFMFELSNKEFANLRSQIVTSSWGGVRYLPMVFTEQGVAMLSSVLNSERAIQVNIRIMRVFTKVREIFMENLSVRFELEEIKKKLENHDNNIGLVFRYLDELIEKHDNPKPRRKVGFKSSDNNN